MCLSVFISVCMSVYVCTCLSICLSIYVSVYLSVDLCICMPVYISTCLSICVSVCLCVYLHICLLDCLSTNRPHIPVDFVYFSSTKMFSSCSLFIEQFFPSLYLLVSSTIFFSLLLNLSIISYYLL